jgi:uncharacterized protein YfaS (alpha-2-macroglobulin family)
VDRIRRGTEIYVEIEIRDRTTSPMSLLDPNEGVFLTLTDPSGGPVLNEVGMSQKTAGVYFYRYQTTANDPLGVWKIEFKARHSARTHLSLAMGAFELVTE